MALGSEDTVLIILTERKKRTGWNEMEEHDTNVERIDIIIKVKIKIKKLK